MRNSKGPSSSFRSLVATVAIAGIMATSGPARADEGGVSMWVPGFFGSLSATPLTPGFALTSILYHSNLDASGAVARARQITIGRFNPVLDISVSAQLAARPNLLLFAPGYTFATPVLGGQANLTLLQGFGHVRANIDATIEASIGPFSVTRTENIFDSRYGFGDFGAQGSLRWNSGVHNFMTTGVLPGS
jgi:hypothetical protein